MTKPVTEATILDIIAIGVDNDLNGFDINMQANWYEDYALDSLGVMTLYTEVTKAFGLDIPQTRMPEIRTGEQLLAVVLELQAANGSSSAAARLLDAVLAESSSAANTPSSAAARLLDAVLAESSSAAPDTAPEIAVDTAQTFLKAA